jgi:hypothetical protein
MARVINVLGLNGLPLPGAKDGLSFIADVQDNYCEWNQHRFHFEVQNELLSVTKINTSGPDSEDGKEASTKPFHLAIQALTGLVYGTFSPE